MWPASCLPVVLFPHHASAQQTNGCFQDFFDSLRLTVDVSNVPVMDPYGSRTRNPALFLIKPAIKYSYLHAA